MYVAARGQALNTSSVGVPVHSRYYAVCESFVAHQLLLSPACDDREPPPPKKVKAPKSEKSIQVIQKSVPVARFSWAKISRFLMRLGAHVLEPADSIAVTPHWFLWAQGFEYICIRLGRRELLCVRPPCSYYIPDPPHASSFVAREIHGAVSVDR